MKLAFCDVETTGKCPDKGHEIWDIGLIIRDGPGVADAEYQWFIKPDLGNADPDAVPVGRYYERAPAPGVTAPNGPQWSDPAKVAPILARLLDRAILVGSNPAFDAKFLAAFLSNHGECGTWSYHLVDVRQRAIGYLLGKGAVASHRSDEQAVDTWKTARIFTQLGVDLNAFRAHEALEDAKIARAVYDLTGGAP